MALAVDGFTDGQVPKARVLKQERKSSNVSGVSSLLGKEAQVKMVSFFLGTFCVLL